MTEPIDDKFALDEANERLASTEATYEHTYEHVYGDVYRCTECGHEQEMDAADFGGPDTVWEARGEQ